MFRTIITTVGTLLQTNAKEETKKQIVGRRDLIEYINVTEATKASAEANSLSKILKDNDRIIFFYSQTEEGGLCAEVLSTHYRSKGYETVLSEVPELTYKESDFKLRGIRSLAASLIEWIQKEEKDGKNMVINATGGFKAEIAYATVVVLLFNVPVYYIHEVFSDVVKLPAVPITWDYSLVADNEELLNWIADCHTTVDVGDRLKALTEEQRNQIRLLLDREDGYTLISPIGFAFFEAYKLRLEQVQTIPLYFPPKGKKLLL